MGFVNFIKALGRPIFSQTRELKQRREAGLHPVNEMRRFFLFTACFFCSICVSVTYAFDVFSVNIKEQFGVKTSDLTIISTVGMVFCYFTIPYSFIFENLGPFLTFWLGAIFAFIGALGLGLVFQGYIIGNTATITVFYSFLNAASGLIDTTYVSTLFEVFPRNRGPVVCLAKVMTGLGSSVLANLSETFFNDSISGFIYFIMALTVVVAIWASFAVVLPPFFVNWWRRQGKTEEEVQMLESTKEAYEHKFVPIPRLIIGYSVVVSLIIFFTVSSCVMAYGNVGDAGRTVIGVLTVVLTMLIFLILLPIPALGGMNDRLEEVDEEEQMDIRSLEDTPDMLHEEPARDDCALPAEEDSKNEGKLTTVGVVAEKQSRQDPRYKGTMLQYLLSIDVWLIMLLFVCYGCTGILVMYNGSTISIALNGKDRDSKTAALYTAFLGVGSSVGRIAFGLFEAYVQHQDPNNRKVIVTMALPFSPCLSFLASLFLLVLPGEAVLFPYILVYIEEGVFAGINALIFPCLFENNHNFLYNLSFLVQCITTICFNLGMFGQVLQNQQARLGIPDNLDCNQRSCVQTQLIVSCVLGFCGIFVAFAIHFRYAAFVRRERRKEAGMASGSEEPFSPSEAEETQEMVQ